jgi:hypothetical protein
MHLKAGAANAAHGAPLSMRTLRLRDRVTDLAADGESAAIWTTRSEGGRGCIISIWHPRTGKLVRVGPKRCDEYPLRSPLAYANGRVAWFEEAGSITEHGALFTVKITRPWVQGLLASNIRGAGAPFNRCTGPDFWPDSRLVGRGRFLAFTTWTYGRCASPPAPDPDAVASTVLWRSLTGPSPPARFMGAGETVQRRSA